MPEQRRTAKRAAAEGGPTADRNDAGTPRAARAQPAASTAKRRKPASKTAGSAAATKAEAKAADRPARKTGGGSARKSAAGSARKPAAGAARKRADGSARKTAAAPASKRRAAPASQAGESARNPDAARDADTPATATLEPASPFLQSPASVTVAPQRLAELQREFLERLQSIVGSGKPEPTGRRFVDPAWHDGGPFGWMAALYELNAEFLGRLADAVDADAKSRDRIRFATQQWVDALSPANFLVTNPEAQRRLIESRGESLRAGLGNLVCDVAKGRISHTDESAFEVGRNVATTPGEVVYENDLIQLIQYTPSTSKVGARPLLMVPPCINKFYILDLQPANSLVAYSVAEGHTVFMLSWRNVGEEQAALSWDDYLRDGVFDAIRVVREISGQPTINALGFCVGGTILAAALAVAAARGERPVESLTLLTTLLDFSEPGVLGVFVDEASATWREQSIGRGGLMRGRELAGTFSALRPNDLVWNYVVSNYLKGETPPAFDLLYWNGDSTNLPGPMFTWYFRHMYLQNELRQSGRLTSLGVPIDLGRIDVPSFVYGSREDHIVPWHAAYASTQLLGGESRFMLGASGHIAGVINPPAANKRSFWQNPRTPADPEQWFAGAESVPGSWWPQWSRWLAQYRGPMVDAPARPGSPSYPPIEPAPGRYVKERAD